MTNTPEVVCNRLVRVPWKMTPKKEAQCAKITLDEISTVCFYFRVGGNDARDKTKPKK